MEQPWMGRLKWLTQALIISGSLNIGFLATFVTFLFKDKNKKLEPGKTTAVLERLETNVSLLRSYCTLPFQDLLLRLETQDLVEDGYTKRDLALACLVSFHHFNLDRALGTIIFPKRLIAFTDSQGLERIEIPIFQGLSDFQFEAILTYAKTEKWPLTSKGLFYELKKGSHLKDPSLIEAFSLTSEYDMLSNLFLKTGHPLNKDQIIQLVTDGEWETLAEAIADQKRTIELNPNSRRNLLLSYLNFRSSIAANLLLTTDHEFVLRRFDDAQLLVFFSLLSSEHPDLESLAKELLLSPRSDAVWNKAAEILYTAQKEVLPEPFDPRVAIEKFCPRVQPPAAAVLASQPELAPPPVEASHKEKDNSSKRIHTIEEGDSLWKIARKYKVSIDSIMKANHLDSEKLRVGKKLEIPDEKKEKKNKK